MKRTSRPTMSLLLCGVLLTLTMVSPMTAREKEPDAIPDIKTLQKVFGPSDMAAFSEPDRIFHPETWFHFIGGNVAAQGITTDVEAIAQAGIEGIQFFHGQFGGPWPGVTPQIKCLSETWDKSLSHIAKECQRLGLRFTMQNCPGWAMAGGPWIQPETAMRHLVWSRLDVTGGDRVSLSLAQPQPSKEPWRDYRDVAVVAFPTPQGDTGKALSPISVKSNHQDLPWMKTLQKAEGGSLSLTPDGEPVWVEVTLDEIVTLRTVEFPSVQGFNHPWCYDPDVTITIQAVLADGLQEVARHEMPQSNWQGNKPISLACSECPAKTYRISINHQHPTTLPYIQLFTGARKTNWQAEAAWVLRGLDRAPHPRQSKTAWIDPARIIDLTSHMDEHARLLWDVPPGRWTVQRWGHVNSGKRNGPAPAEATGWECDKLSQAGADTHFAGYIGRVAGGTGPVSGGLLQGMLLDSWECETQTWTPDMENQFSGLRGYPMRGWFPALAGYVVSDPETTGRFLRDWRATINDLVVKNFFGRLAELGHEHGISLSFETASGDVFPGDILEYYKHADVPMCEFWHPRSEAYVGSFDFKPVKPCVSAARLYGKPRVAAEAFTSFSLTWTEHPGMLKAIADQHFAEGVTHLVFHTYTHNPRTDFLPPGTSFGSGIGTPFLRGQTWWKHMPTFTAYLARCSYLLERGQPVSDVLWYLGDELDHKPPQNSPFPAGYRYDYCNPDVLLNRLSVRDGRLVTPEGLQYRVLWLRRCPRMLPETLDRMVSLVKAGAVIVGERPQGLATLSGGQEAETRFRRAVDTLWGTSSVTDSEGTVRQVGKGRVLSGMALGDALAALDIGPDVQSNDVVWTHRKTQGADWYFVAAPASQGFRGTLKFRSVGTVEFWNPMTGAVTPAGLVQREGPTSRVSLDLAPSGSVFVVFRSSNETTSNPIVRVAFNGVSVADTQIAESTESHPQVVSATYGDPSDTARRKDVTDIVRQNLLQGKRVITASNAWAQGDPALQTRKKLFVRLHLPEGQVRDLEAWENAPLSLVEPAVPPRVACDIVDHGTSLVAWEPGVYSATREDASTVTWKTDAPQRVPCNGPWTLGFPAGWGAPEAMRVDRLTSWTELDLPPEAKAFSGTGVYTTEFTLPRLAPGAHVELDLGRVAVIAEVCLNGQTLESLWSPPYRQDVTRAVNPGKNQLSVKVTSTWFNRLAYDAGLDEKARKTWTINGPAKESSPLPAGLLGPVAVRIGQALGTCDRQ